MSKSIKVSIVLPCYNSEQQLEKCLFSILNQTLQEIELICIDDGSTDSTLEILSDYADRDSRITLLKQENKYAGVARNKGLVASKGKYVFFMDSDDYLNLDAMEKAYAQSERHQSDICIFGAGTLDLTTDERHYSYPIKDTIPKKLPFSRKDVGKGMITICHMAAWNKLYNREFVINSGLDFQPLQRSNDVFFCQTTIIEANRITVVDEWLYTRTINSGTSLVETMDENPYPFYEASQRIKQYFEEKGLYEFYKKQILQRCLYSAIHVLKKLKTKEKFLEVITFLKEVAFVEFGIWENKGLFSLNMDSTKNLVLIMETPTEELQNISFNHETGLLEHDIKVSVIVPCYNVERFLHECLDSILNQSLKEIEIICIDDGSTDKTIEILDTYTKKDSRLTYITQENQYAGVARNKGMEIARGKYLSFLDSDDFFEPIMLEEMYHQCEKDTADFCITGGATYDMSTNEVTYKYKVRHEKLPSKIPFSYKDIPNDIFSASFIAPWSKLYKKSFIDKNKLQFQALQRSNDYFFTQSAMVLANRITIVDRCLFTYRIGTSTSLVETMDQNPFCFYKANKALYDLLQEHSIYEDVKKSFKRSALSGAHHALSMLKTKEAWLEVANFIKNQYIPEFKLNVNPKEYTNLATNLEMLEFFARNTHEELKTHNPILRKDELTVMQVKPEFALKLNNNAKKVSIIIPIHNGELYLEGCLRSVLNQSLKDVEVICIDDGSTDQTAEILARICDEDDRVVILTQEKNGQSSARNAGLKIAQGEYIMFVDVDDLLMKLSVEQLYRKAKYYDVDDLFCEGKAFFDPMSLHKKHRQQLTNYGYGRAVYQISSGREILQMMLQSRQFRPSINTRLFKHSFLKENMLEFTNEPLHEEKIFTMRSLNVAERVMVHKEPLYFIRIHPESISLTEDSLNRFYSWGMCLVEALKRAKNNEHCEHSESFRSLAAEYEKQMYNKFNEIKKHELQLSQKTQDMFSEIEQELDSRNDLSSFFQKILKRFKSEVINGRQVPDLKKIDRTGRYIFGQDEEEGRNSIASLFSVILQHTDTNNVSLVTDFIHMGRYAPLIRNTLYLSFSLKRSKDTLKPVLHQAEWESGEEEVFLENYYYTLNENVLTIFAKYTGLDTGIQYRIKDISSRGEKSKYSVTRNQQGYGRDELPLLTKEHTPIKNVKLSRFDTKLYYGKRALFRNSKAKGKGIDLFSIELSKIELNGITFATDITYLAKERIAIYDTLFLSFNLGTYKEKLKPTVKQAEWRHGYKLLKNNIYYYIQNNILYIGARHNGPWCGYNYKITHLSGRKKDDNYIVTDLAPEFIESGMKTLSENIVFVTKTIEWDK